MKVYINRKPIVVPWGGGAHFYNAFWKHAPTMNISLNVDTPDIVLIAGLDVEDGFPSAEQLLSIKKSTNAKFVLRVNENDARKGTNHVDKRLIDLSKTLDGTIFVSDWLKRYFSDWKCLNSTVIHNGVDKNIFFPRPKLNNGKINILAHHWSNNHKKGFDIYDELDKFVGEDNRFTFTYVGRDMGTFKNTKVISPLCGLELGNEIGKYDVYVSASRFDPGPNHISESISSELPTYVHSDGGGCVEFAGNDHVYQNWEELKSILLNRKFTSNLARFNDWETCIKSYIMYLRSV